MSIYTVTFCAMDGDVGANPLWHACLLLSKFDETSNKLEVVDTWGFYGMPTTGKKDTFLQSLKLSLKIDTDLVENHGKLRHEEIRYLDSGCGLHGSTFELTEEKFQALQDKCKKMVAEEDQAIKEVVEPLKLNPKPPKEKVRIYPYEHLSHYIFGIEKAKAEQEKRQSRLKPFELVFSRRKWVLPSVNKSSSCKTQALDLLQDILTHKQINRLSENGTGRPHPRSSGKMEYIYLHSIGQLHSHEKEESKEVVYSRKAEDKDVKLYWSIPPQEIETLSQSTADLFKHRHPEHTDQIKKIVSQLQKLEWLFTNATFSSRYMPLRDTMINYLHKHYEIFSIADSSTSFVEALTPKSESEDCLLDKLEHLKDFINNVYWAAADNWEIVDDALAESKLSDDEKLWDSEYAESLASLAAQLPSKMKTKISKILGSDFSGVAALLPFVENKICKKLGFEFARPMEEVGVVSASASEEKESTRRMMVR